MNVLVWNEFKHEKTDEAVKYDFIVRNFSWVNLPTEYSCNIVLFQCVKTGRCVN